MRKEYAHYPKKLSAICFFVFILLLFLTFPLNAQSATWLAPEIASRSAVVMDAATGTIIYTKNPDLEIPPASMTKLMTMYLAFREINAGRASLDEIIEPGRESWAVNQLPLSSLMHLGQGQSLSLRELLLGLAVASGNDAAAAVALRFAPTIDDFVAMMNREAHSLGLIHTSFVDASGYSELNMTTANDFAKFCRIYLEAYPQSLVDFHSVIEYSYPLPEHQLNSSYPLQAARLQRNRNSLLERVNGVDGLKTGSIPAAGFNIALTAERNDTRFIAIIMGAPYEQGGDRIRDNDGELLLEWAFNNYRTLRIDTPHIPLPRVWKGRDNYVELNWDESLTFTAFRERGENIVYDIEIVEPIIAPISAGTHVGNITVYDSLGVLRVIPVHTAYEVERGGFFKRLIDSIRLFFGWL